MAELIEEIINTPDYPLLGRVVSEFKDSKTIENIRETSNNI